MPKMSEQLTWKQKALAIRGLVGEQRFHMGLNERGQWYCLVSGVHFKGDGFETSPGAFHCSSFEEAIEHAWVRLTEKHKNPNVRLYVMPLGGLVGDDYPVHWNGFMWDRLPE
jgi:hypothetical protein